VAALRAARAARRPRRRRRVRRGFRLDASRGGYVAEGRTVRPLVDGRASLVITGEGTASAGQWGRDATLDGTRDFVAMSGR
jgi:hypothetical protein